MVNDINKLIERLGGNTDELKTNLDTEKYDYIIECLGGDVNELKTNLNTEKIEKIKELLNISTEIDTESDFLDYLMELYPELDKSVAEGEYIVINDSTAAECEIEVQGNIEQISRSAMAAYRRSMLDESVVTYFLENYADYIEEYYVVGECNSTYFMYTSPSQDMVIRHNNVQMTNKGDSQIDIRFIQLNTSDMSQKKNTKITTSKNQAVSQFFIKYDSNYANYFFYTNYDLYDSNGNFILAKNYPIEEEPEEEGPTPENPWDIYTVKGNCKVLIENGDYTKSQIYELTIPEQYELAKIGDYEDYFYKENGSWYKHKAIDKYAVTGNEFWRYYTETEINQFYFVYEKMLHIAKNNIISNCYKGDLIDNRNGNYGIIYTYTNGIAMNDKNYTTLEAYLEMVKTKYAVGNPMMVYCVLSAPVKELITDRMLIGQLESLSNARTYYGTTNINAIADINPTLKVTYKQIKG